VSASVERFEAPVRLDARSIPTELWAVLALVAVAAVIRFITIDNQSFWMDEALTAYEAHLPFGAMLNTVFHVETTPPLYFVLIWAWAHVFGTGEVALRMISTLAGIALVPVAYLSARELISQRAGMIAAALVAVNPFLIWYSQEARGYMLLALLSGLSFLWFQRAVRDASRHNLVRWAAFSCLALMTHFFAGFLVAPEAVWLLWMSRTRAVGIAVASVAVVQVAMLPFAVTDTGHGAGWIAAQRITTRMSQAALEWALSIEYRRTHLIVGYVGVLVLVLLVAALILRGGDRLTRRGAGVAAAIAGFVLLAPLAFALAGQDYWLARNEIPAVVPLVTLLAAACAAPRLRALGATLALGLMTIFVVAAIHVQTHIGLERPDWRGVARVLGPATVPRAILAAGGAPDSPLKIYLPGVHWVQPKNRPVLIGEIDVVGAYKHFPLGTVEDGRLQLSTPPVRLAPIPTDAPDQVGGRRRRSDAPIPRQISPPGTTLVARGRFDNWVVARWRLQHPRWLTIRQLTVMSPRFFRRTPAPSALLVFTQGTSR
jgi:hypothetical protein